MRITRFPLRAIGSRLVSHSARFRRDTGGNFAITLAICAIPLFLTAGLALDYSSAYMFRGRLQNAVDAATLAAGGEITRLEDGELEALVLDFIASNLQDGDIEKIDAYDIDIDRAKLGITVTADARMPANFAPLVGISTLDYRVMASIQASSTGIEAVLVLDNTGSMAHGGKMTSLKKAAGAFVEDMLALNETKPDLVRIGIVPFADYVNVGKEHKNASWIDVPSGKKGKGKGKGSAKWDGCVGSRAHPMNLKDSGYAQPVPGLSDVTCPSAITPLSRNESHLKKQVNAFVPNGYTYIPAGLMWGMRVLSSQAPFTEGLTEAEAEEKRVKKAVILMTDGENTVSQSSNTAYHSSHDPDQANLYTAAACNAIKAEDIVVYTMTFGSSVPAATKELIRSCASKPDYYFDAANGDSLEGAFADIAASLAKLYLTH